MSLNRQPLYLNADQDFDTPFEALADLASDTIEWELVDAIPAVRRAVCPETAARIFSPSRYVTRRAPSKLNPTGPRWYEHAPVVARILTLCQHIREYQI
jgi:hypothetical protein